MMQKQKLKACLLAIVGVACMSFSQSQFALQGTYTAPDGTILKRGLRGEQIYTTIKQILSDKK
jgi:hypothetical protein